MRATSSLGGSGREAEAKARSSRKVVTPGHMPWEKGSPKSSKQSSSKKSSSRQGSSVLSISDSMSKMPDEDDDTADASFDVSRPDIVIMHSHVDDPSDSDDDVDDLRMPSAPRGGGGPVDDSADQETVMSLPDIATATWMREDIEKAIAGGMQMDSAEMAAFEAPDDE